MSRMSWSSADAGSIAIKGCGAATGATIDTRLSVTAIPSKGPIVCDRAADGKNNSMLAKAIPILEQEPARYADLCEGVCDFGLEMMSSGFRSWSVTTPIQLIQTVSWVSPFREIRLGKTRLFLSESKSHARIDAYSMIIIEAYQADYTERQTPTTAGSGSMPASSAASPCPLFRSLAPKPPFRSREEFRTLEAYESPRGTNPRGASAGLWGFWFLADRGDDFAAAASCVGSSSVVAFAAGAPAS